MANTNVKRVKTSDLELKDRLVAIQRVTKVTKGGRHFRFAAIVVVGDENGVVGYGLGKANEVTAAIAKGVEFIMNGANHRMGSVSTYPFNIMGGGWEKFAPELGELPFKGDTVVGNDVWIGQNAVILPGVHIGDGAIIGANSVVGSNVEPYSVVAGNPARLLRRRFDDETIGLLSRLKWWDKDIDEINRLIPILTCCDIEKVKAELKKIIQT